MLGQSQRISHGIPQTPQAAQPSLAYTPPPRLVVPKPPVPHSPLSSGLASVPAAKQRSSRATTSVATMVPPLLSATTRSLQQLAPGRGLAQQ